MNIDREPFLTGIPLIDRQHEHYLNLCESLFKACEADKVDQATVDAGLSEVLAYAVEHFDAEEALMQSTDYAHYDEHYAKHDEFRDEAERLSNDGRSATSPAEQLNHLTKWMIEWFLDQTRVHDARLAAHLKKERYRSATE